MGLDHFSLTLIRLYDLSAGQVYYVYMWCHQRLVLQLQMSSLALKFEELLTMMYLKELRDVHHSFPDVTKNKIIFVTWCFVIVLFNK